MLVPLIELEDETTLKVWYEEFWKPENTESQFIPNCIYSFDEIERELVRRENIKGE